MAYVDPDVLCPKKADKLNHSPHVHALNHLFS